MPDELSRSRPPSDPQNRATRDLAYRTVTITAIVLAMVLIVLVAYFAASTFFLVFAALLLASILTGLAHLIQKLGAPRWLAMVLVYVLTIIIITAPLAWGGIALVQQFNDLWRGVQSQVDQLVQRLTEMGIPVGGNGESGGSQIQNLLPSGLFSSASRVVFSFLGGFGNFFVVVFLAAFISWQPHLYRDGLLSLFPREKRARLKDTLHDSAHSLLMWVAGTAISMATVFVVSWIGLALIGMPNAFLLSLQAGFLAFIPTLGPFVAGAVIVLAGLAVSGQMALWGLGVYLLIQGVESNITTPIAQRWTTSLPPALTLGFQVLFGLLFGLLGFVLAVPMLAVLTVIVRKLYIEDVLGGPAGEAKA